MALYTSLCSGICDLYYMYFRWKRINIRPVRYDVWNWNCSFTKSQHIHLSFWFGIYGEICIYEQSFVKCFENFSCTLHLSASFSSDFCVMWFYALFGFGKSVYDLKCKLFFIKSHFRNLFRFEHIDINNSVRGASISCKANKWNYKSEWNSLAGTWNFSNKYIYVLLKGIDKFRPISNMQWTISFANGNLV